MGWFSKSKLKQRRTPTPGQQDMWIRCGGCNAHVFREDWENNLNVCSKCNFHGRLTAYQRIGMTLDPGTFREMDQSISPGDPLGFIDGKGSYAEKAEATRRKTGLNEAVVTGAGKIEGISVAVAVMDFRFLGGSLGSGAGEKILRAATVAYDRWRPLVIFSASGGARMHEGVLSLMQMAKTCAGIARLNKRRLPYISVMTHPTTGGVSASFATVGDVNIAEPGALIGFAGRRVIEQTIKQKLPDDFQTAEYLLEHGFVDLVVPRRELKKTLGRVLSYYNR